MKTKKSHRLLSALLAVLLVFAVCPIIALSASETTNTPATQAEVEYWDGTVPGNFADAGMTIPEFIMSGKTYIVSYEEYAKHIGETYNVSSVEKNEIYTDLTIKDEIGFAMLVLFSNCPYEITDKPTDPEILYFPGTSDGTPQTAMDHFNYRYVFLERDLYLNAPGEHKNQVAPLFWKMLSPSIDKWFVLYFEGQNHFISGWYTNATLSDNLYVSNGFYGALPNAGFKVENLALVDMKMKLTTKSGFTKTAAVGGIVGGGEFIEGCNGSVTIKNCYVDMEVAFTTHATSASDAIGDHTITDLDKVEIGGLVGPLSYSVGYGGVSPTSYIDKINLSNNVVKLTYALSRPWAGVSGLIVSALQTAAANIQNNVVLQMSALLEEASAKTGFLFSDAITDQTNILNNWTVGAMKEAFTTASDTNKTVSVANMESETYWAENGTAFGGTVQKPEGVDPIPSVFAENTAFLATLQFTPATGFESDLNDGRITYISTADELVRYVNLANELGKPALIRLTANIDMESKCMPVIDNLRLLDGQGHIISNYKNNILCNPAGTREHKMGGFCHTLSGTIKNVAFTNYYVTFDALSDSTEYWVGGLYGEHGGGTLSISGVYLEGFIAITGTETGNTRIGYFGASEKHDAGNVGITIENSVFTGQVTGVNNQHINYFAANFGSSLDDWCAILTAGTNGTYTIGRPHRQIQITNCYAIPYTVTNDTASLTSHIGNGIGAASVALRYCYQAGMAKDVAYPNNGGVGYTNVVDASGNSLAYLDKFNHNAIGTGSGTSGAYTLADFKGLQGTSKMTFSNNSEWTWFADGTPIPSVFGDNAASLSIKTVANRELVTNAYSVKLMGGQMRIDRSGLRFIGVFDTSYSSDYYIIEYGFLVLPSVALGDTTQDKRTLAYTDPVAQRICTTDISKMHAAGSQKALENVGVLPDNYSALFGTLTNVPEYVLASNEFFTVTPYIAFLTPEQVEYNNAITSRSDQRQYTKVIYADDNGASTQQFSGVYLANAFCASPYVYPVFKTAVCDRFKDVAGFNYTFDENNQIVPKS